MGIPIIQFIGYSGTGKTTLLAEVLSNLSTKHGLRIATIKHSHHEPDLPLGKDTTTHLQAGAQLSIVQSPHTLAWWEKQGEEQPLHTLVERIAAKGRYDMILIEGYKQESYPKVLMVRRYSDLKLLEQATNVEAIYFWQEEDLSKFQGADYSHLSHQPALFHASERQGFIQWLLASDPKVTDTKRETMEEADR